MKMLIFWTKVIVYITICGQMLAWDFPAYICLFVPYAMIVLFGEFMKRRKIRKLEKENLELTVKMYEKKCKKED